MAHHGWVPVLDRNALTPTDLHAPFGRLFPSAAHAYDSLAIALLTGAHGPMEGADTLGKPEAGRKAGLPRGFTFLGQLIDHDMTEFRVVAEDLRLVARNPVIGQRQRVLEDGALTCTNGRIPTLDLDCLYGVLGLTQPSLFDGTGLFQMETAEGFDLKRGRLYANDRLIADPRNDENKLVVQIHLLFERLHNKIHGAKLPQRVAEKKEDHKKAEHKQKEHKHEDNEKQIQKAEAMGVGSPAFNATRAEVVAIYRRIVLCDYLPRIVQPKHISAVIDKLKDGKTFYQRMNARAEAAYKAEFPKLYFPGNFLAMPVEFAHAAFRLGHSQLRSRYRLNTATEDGFPLFALDQEAKLDGDGKPIPVADLRGSQKLEAKFQIDWRFFFSPPGTEGENLGEPIDAKITSALFRLPPPSIGEPPTSLAERNIRRGVDFGLPSGQEAAAHLSELYGDIDTIDPDLLFPDQDFRVRYQEILDLEPSLAWATPLWYYILREAGAYTEGPQLGAVGGLIVAETILGSLAHRAPAAGKDDPAFDLGKAWERCQAANMTATPEKTDDIFTMSQLIAYLTAA